MAADLFAEIAGDRRAVPPLGVTIVAVDGFGGAGKSTFARALAQALGGAPVVPNDDFAG